MNIYKKINNFITEENLKNTKIEKIDDNQVSIKNFPSIFGDILNKNGIIVNSEVLKREASAYKELIELYPYQKFMLDGHAEKNVSYTYSYDLVIGYITDIRYNVTDNCVYIDFNLFNKDNIFEKIIYQKLPLGVSSILQPIETYEIRYDEIFETDKWDKQDIGNYKVNPSVKNKIIESIKKYEGFEFYFNDIISFKYIKDFKLLRFDVVWMPAYETFITGISAMRNYNRIPDEDPIVITGDTNSKQFDNFLVNTLTKLEPVVGDYSKRIIDLSIKYLSKEPDIIYSAAYNTNLSKITNSNQVWKFLNTKDKINKYIYSQISPFYLDFLVKDYITKYRLNLNKNKIITFNGYKPIIKENDNN